MENKINIAPFVIGDKVVCIKNSRGGSLTVGKKYTITAIVNRCSCGFKVNVDNMSDRYIHFGIQIKNGECVRCGGCSEAIISNGLVMFNKDRFRKIQEQKPPLLTFEKIKEEEKEEVLIMN